MSRNKRERHARRMEQAHARALIEDAWRTARKVTSRGELLGLVLPAMALAGPGPVLNALRAKGGAK